jgi:predicted HD phosphohydrolase
VEDAMEEIAELPDRVLDAVANLRNFQGALQVTRYEHSLQSATRAYRDGKDEEYVVMCLVHDIGDTLAPYSHGPLVAAVIKPFVSERVRWIVEKHPLFQSYYFAHHLGADRNARDKYKDHPYYEDTIEFCAKYDQNCFDPDYDSLPLEFFEPMVHRVFGRQPDQSVAWDD